MLLLIDLRLRLVGLGPFEDFYEVNMFTTLDQSSCYYFVSDDLYFQFTDTGPNIHNLSSGDAHIGNAA